MFGLQWKDGGGCTNRIRWRRILKSGTHGRTIYCHLLVFITSLGGQPKLEGPA